MTFDIKDAFKHLDGGSFSYSDLLKKFEDTHAKYLKELTSHFRAGDFFELLSKGGWLLVNHGVFEVSFDEEHNKKRLKEIEDSWK